MSKTREGARVFHIEVIYDDDDNLYSVTRIYRYDTEEV